ncbi:MAG: alpha/beta hydrolase [Lachnospiraceae bacterium]|nr:alpha/beta hydrolase [Lachnospiraceae bacterium]MCI9149880.1 alpha/beta hydrolase [Lachnospiraceae bacterium]
MAYASVNGVELYYDEFGSGDQVVICASGGDFKHPDPDVWPYYMASYGYHLYTVTLRGHWKSTHITEDYGKEWYNIWADDIYEFGKLVGAKRFVYMGLSHGSGVGWHLADRHPEVLKSFIAIVCGPHYLCGDLNEKQTSFARERTIQAADDPELKLQLIKEQEPDWSRIPPERLEEEKRRWQEHYEGWMEMSPEEMRLRPRIAFAWIDTEEELMEKLKTIKVPMLMLGACQDKIINPKAMLRSACAVPNAKTILWQSADHGFAMGRDALAEDARDEILLFLKQQERREAEGKG